MRIIKWILPIVVLALAVFSFIQLKNSRPQLPPKPPQERAWNVQAQTIEPGLQSPQIQLYAEVESPQVVKLTAAIEADVSVLNAREGARFTKGDLLIELDTRDIDLQIAQQEAQLASLEAQLESEKLQHETNLAALKIEESMLQISERSLRRQQDLSTRNLASQEALDSAEINSQQRALNLVSRRQAIANHPHRVKQLEASIDQARAQLASLTLDRTRAHITAPFDGRVLSVNVAQGDRMRSGELLATLYPDSELEIRAQLPMRLLPLIKQTDGSLAEIQGQVILDGQPTDVRLSRLSAEVNRGSAGLDALFRFEDQTLAPEPGRTLELTLTLPAINQLVALPPTALYGTDRVYKIVDSRLQAVQVQHFGDLTDAQGAPRVLIQSDDLKTGDQVITTQLPNAVSGILIEVTP